MDQIEQKNFEIIKSSNLFKRAARLLLSVSLLFSYYSLYYFFLQYSKNSHFTCSLRFSFDKNCVFLIFNGILVLIAKTSGSLQSRSGFDLNDHSLLVDNIEDGLQMATGSGSGAEYESFMLEVKESESLEKGIEDHGDHDQYHLIKEEGENRLSDELKVENEEEDGKCGSPFEDGGRRRSGTFMDENGEDVCDDDVEEEEEDRFEEEEEEDRFEEEETNIGVLSTEELNKKFDEFIRKMKEEIRIEAQRRVIMV